MSNHPHRPYTDLVEQIDEAGGVPCQALPEIFFPEDISNKAVREAATATARAMCKECPLTLQCFEYAITTNQRYGIWGGTLASER